MELELKKNEATADDDAYFLKIKDAIKKKLNTDFDHYSTTFIKRRISARMISKKITTYKEYYESISNDSAELDLLKTNFSINTTSFFRDPSFWEAFKNEVLKKMIYDEKRRKINIWSAGCSSGEEPYTIAMILAELQNNKTYDCEIKITATDINPDILAKAEKGEYEQTQLNEVPKDLVEKNFRKHEKNYVINENLKKNITFKKHDMLNEDPLKNMDIILCRNTVIYFSADTKKELYKRFYEAINPQSYLILGKTEIMQGDARNQFKIYNTTERIYTKN